MTTEEFERIMTAFSAMAAYNINGNPFVSLENVIKIVHSNLNRDDRGLYIFDFQKGTWVKKEPGQEI